ncbi:MAG: CCA tRNA nucleotidyltransferase [Deltaproteobacteria bacterium]|nr:CCA tRNA nucleotidyltransferase [Deltaproteobacteria bacterium]
MRNDISEGLREFLAGNPALLELGGLLESGNECFLVGGAVRDLLLRRPAPDIDLATPRDPAPLARRFAVALRGTFFFLDQERGHSRVVVRREGRATAFDFAPFRAPDLKGDLAARDFTINALAWPLHLPPEEAALVDPLGGCRDLERGLLRCCGPEVLRDDPLRVLRGVRLAVYFDLAIEDQTRELMAAAVLGLHRVASERILAELGKVFSFPCALRGAELLRELGCFPVLFGPAVGGAERIAAGLALLREVAASLAAGRWDWLGTEKEAGWDGAALLRLAAVLRGIGVAWEDEKLRGLPSGREARRLIRELLSVPADLLAFYRSLACSERGKALWLETLGRYPREQLIFSGILSGEGMGLCQAAWEEALSLWERFAGEGAIPPLIKAEELVADFGVAPGPEIGRLLRELSREEISGRVAGRLQALRWLRKRLERD